MIALGLRVAIVLCVILALAGLEIARPSDQLAVVFLIDASDSMSDEAKGLATDCVRQALRTTGRTIKRPSSSSAARRWWNAPCRLHAISSR